MGLLRQTIGIYDIIDSCMKERVLMKTAIILSGIPGSGKSTYAKQLGLPHFSSDFIRLELFQTLRKHHTKADDQLVFDILHERVFSCDTSLIYDATNISRNMRGELYQKFKSRGYHVELHMILEPLMFANFQNERRSFEKVVPFYVLNDMYKFMGAPRVGVDCDAYKIISQSKFLNPNVNYSDFVSVAEDKGINQAVKQFINAAYLPEFIKLTENHESPYHLEDIDEHINMCIKNAPTDVLKIVSILHDLGKTQAKENGHYKGHDMISSMYALRFFDEIKNVPKEIIPRDIIEIVYHHMTAHQGLSEKVIQQHKLEPHVVASIQAFNDIDEKSRFSTVSKT